MCSLKLWLFGPPRFEVNGSPLELNRHKAAALLAYLAVSPEEKHRDKLAAMFWPDSTQERARSSLRRDLSIINSATEGIGLIITRETIGFDDEKVQVDVTLFQDCLAECKNHGHSYDIVCSACIYPLTQAVSIYRDDFLAGFTLSDCPEFDDWQFFQSEELRQELQSALSRLIQGYGAQGNLEEALAYGRRLISLDPLQEDVHRQLMRLYARTGQKGAALRQYELCRNILEEELGVEPSSETLSLYEQIRKANEEIGPTKSEEFERLKISSFSQNVAAPLNNLPIPATPFVGRVEGLVNIAQRLNDPSCRLLTLLGPGGVGKTRLAIQAAWNLVDNEFNQANFRDGVYFIRLISIHSSNHLVSAIADALNFSFFRKTEPKEQLFHFLHEKNLLLVLDNFEHLISAPPQSNENGEVSHSEDFSQGWGATFLADLLAASKSVKILVTSREAINLQEEWVLPVEGMRYPTIELVTKENNIIDLERYSAVQLFTLVAKRVDSTFLLSEQQDCVLKICQLVEGIPLAIELAASWLKVMSCAEVAQEITKSLDFLTTSLRDVPSRHRSMRAVFDQSWELLSAHEQTIMRRLTVFHGGFQQDAAEAVAGATFFDLSVLVEKSLIRSVPNGRYVIHELLRQFASEKLANYPEEKEETNALHCDFFITFLQGREVTINSRQQKSALKEIRQEIKNIRKAWDYAVSKNKFRAIEPSIDILYTFYWISSRFREGVELFTRAEHRLRNQDVSEELLVKLTARQGSFYASLGVFDLARELIQKSLSEARMHKIQQEIVFSLNILGNIVDVQGEGREAVDLYQESLKISREIGDQGGTATSLYNLGWIAVGLGKYRGAQPDFQESLKIYRSIEHQSGIAHALDSLGMSAFFLGEYRDAEHYFQDSLNIFETLEDKHGLARAIGGLGLVAWGLGGTHLVEAKHLLEESLNINRAIGHRLEVARRLAYLGSIENSLEDFGGAQQFLEEALTISREIGFTFGIPWSLSGLGTAVLGQGNFSAAKSYFFEALETARDSQDVPVILDTLVSFTKFLLQENEFPLAQTQIKAVEILTLVIHHPATWQIIHDNAIQMLDQLRSEIPPEELRAAQNRGKAIPIETCVMDLLVTQS